jgi:hypothetical protein
VSVLSIRVTLATPCLQPVRSGELRCCHLVSHMAGPAPGHPIGPGYVARGWPGTTLAPSSSPTGLRGAASRLKRARRQAWHRDPSSARIGRSVFGPCSLNWSNGWDSGSYLVGRTAASGTASNVAGRSDWESVVVLVNGRTDSDHESDDRCSPASCCRFDAQLRTLSLGPEMTFGGGETVGALWPVLIAGHGHGASGMIPPCL